MPRTCQAGLTLCAVPLGRLASYMESAHEFFSENFHGVFETEAEAERFALSSQPRLWAVVVVRARAAFDAHLTHTAGLWGSSSSHLGP